VKVGGITLTKDVDYDLTYANNVDAGTAYVVITGKGNYKDTVRKAFTITNPTTSNSETVPPSDDGTVADTGAGGTDTGAGAADNEGGAADTGAGGTDTGAGGTDTGAGTADTGAGAADTGAGTAVTGGGAAGTGSGATGTGGGAAGTGSGAIGTGGGAADTGNGASTVDSSLTEESGAADKKTSDSQTRLTTRNTTIKLSRKSYTYDGNAKKPTVKVYNSKGKALKSKYYTVTYKNNTRVGKATLTIKFKGKYTGTIKATYTIKPKATALTGTSSKTDRVTLTWKKQTKQVTGYQIQYATNSKFTKSKTTVLVKGAKKSSETITDLSGKTKYYFRIRTYKTVNGKKYYSAWSKAQAVKTK
jgi:hypothetical protein